MAVRGAASRVLGRGLGAVAALLSAAAFAVQGTSVPQSSIDPQLLKIDEAAHLGDPVPRDLPLVDASGRTFRIGEMLGKPLILLFSYYSCDGSCPTLHKRLAAALGEVERFRLGRDYRVLTVSFDRHDTAASAAHFAAMTALRPPPEGGWRFAVVSEPEKGIDLLTGSVGFKYFWSRADQVFLHPNVVVFLTPEGRVARYLYGLNLDPETITLALIDADWGRISTTAAVMDLLTGVCFSYNFKDGRYHFNYSLLIGGCAMLFGLALVLFSTVGLKNKRLRGLLHV